MDQRFARKLSLMLNDQYAAVSSLHGMLVLLTCMKV
jgi:hypothetical protein